MLKKYLITPAQPRCAETHFSPGGVLASFRRHWALTASRPSANVTLIILRVADLAVAAPAERRVLARRGWAGEKDGLFDHPAGVFFCRAIREDHRRLECQDRFYVVCEHPMTALPMCYSFQSAAVFLL